MPYFVVVVIRGKGDQKLEAWKLEKPAAEVFEREIWQNLVIVRPLRTNMVTLDARERCIEG